MKRLMLAVAIIFASLVPAKAGQPTQAQGAAIRSACPTDYKTYCSSVPPGGQASLSCLQQNVSKLSGDCQSAVQATMSTGAPASSSTKSTTAPSSNTGGTTTATPSSKNKSAATTPTASVPITSLTPRQQLFLVRQACHADFQKYCGGVMLGGGRGAACLEANRAKLSAGCVGAIAQFVSQ
jgi:hypothetical protein